MSKHFINAIPLLILVTLLVAGCGSPSTLPASPTAEPAQTTAPTALPSPTVEVTPTAALTATPVSKPPPTAETLAHLALSATAGDPPVLDGQISPGEWNDALHQEFTGGGELLLMHSDGYLYLAVRTNFATPTDVVSAVCLAHGDQVSILHSSASLGTAIFERNSAQWQATQTFDWALNELSADPAEAERQRQTFLTENRWLATLGTATTTGEVEYQIAVPEEPFSLALAYLLPPRASRLEAAWWPAGLADDCRKVTLLQGDSGQGRSTPLRLKFAPETWVTVDLRK